jgi:hypothetical protein
MMGAAGAAGEKVYVEDVFSTYLYTGNGSTQTITNGIDLAGEGGLVWTKSRSMTSNGNHRLIDTVRGAGYSLISDLTNGQALDLQTISSFGSTGYSIGNDAQVNFASQTFVSWTFRKAAKFFDVVTYTGDGTSSQTIPHSLESQPGFIIVKRTDSTGSWPVDSRAWSLNVMGGNPNSTASLNSTAAFSYTGAFAGPWCYGSNETIFRVYNNTTANINGATYVAYLFASDAGGFGDAGTDNVISCGSYTTDGSEEATVDLGWEPQWVLFKRTDSSTGGDWNLFDTMRGLTADTTGDGAKLLEPNTSDAELATNRIAVTSTGFKVDNYGSNRTYIYIAIRRGPMRAPESGTEVFNTGSATSPEPRFKSNFPVDLGLFVDKGQEFLPILWADRLRGGKLLTSSSTDAETTGSISGQSYTGTLTEFDYQNGFYSSATSDAGQRHWSFRRAPGFFDVVAYSGSGSSGLVVNHNLGVSPELLIFKNRGSAANWFAMTSANYGRLNTAETFSSPPFMSFSPTTFTINTTGTSSNANGQNYIAYLFATLAGVSKVGSYTGTGTTLSIDCGFTAGARFVMIKRTDSTGDWYVWDTARGIISGNDPYLLLNSTAAEVTDTDYIDPLSSGFQISSTAPAAINASGGSYIFLAIA